MTGSIIVSQISECSRISRRHTGHHINTIQCIKNGYKRGFKVPVVVLGLVARWEGQNL
jgi:hypothetical protein